MKLIPHRWAMHVIKALSNGEAELLDRIFQELPQAKENINLPIKVFTNGAAFEYYDYGKKE
jgi:hypothetical protein